MPFFNGWGVEVVTLWNVFPELEVAMQAYVDKCVRTAAFHIQARASDNAPIDTGFLKASIYVVTKRSNGYNAAADAALEENPFGTLLPPLDQPTRPALAYVAVGANYGLYVELGTSHMAAIPYLTPAAEAERPALIAALMAMEEGMAL